MTENALGEWIRSLGLPSVDEAALAYAAQLQQIYGGDAQVIRAAGLCGGDLAGALAALADEARAESPVGFSSQQVAMLSGVLRHLADPGDEPDTLEARILRDAMQLAALRHTILGPNGIAAAGERLKALHFPASRQQAARDYALVCVLAEQAACAPTLESLVLRGHYIVFEGIDGAGKNVQAERLIARLREAGRDVIYHEEPIPDRLKQLQAAFDSPSPTVELFLYTADRVEATGRIVRPALAAGKDVVSVRCFVSTMAYQSEHYSPAEIVLISKHVPMPSLVLLLDISPEQGLARVAQRRRTATKYEKLERLTHARERYHEVLKLFPQAVVIDAAPSIDAVAESVWKAVRTTFTL